MTSESPHTERIHTIKERLSVAALRAGYRSARAACKSLKIDMTAYYAALKTDNAHYRHWPTFAQALDIPLEWLQYGGPLPWALPDVHEQREADARRRRSTDMSEDELVDRIQVLERLVAVQASKYIEASEQVIDKGGYISPRALSESQKILDELL